MIIPQHIFVCMHVCIFYTCIYVCIYAKMFPLNMYKLYSSLVLKNVIFWYYIQLYYLTNKLINVIVPTDYFNYFKLVASHSKYIHIVAQLSPHPPKE